ncbi:MAG: zinc ribbon domain-containing protein [bacterium]|nr:zinc ribbon domain-containing protein [bacterium]
MPIFEYECIECGEHTEHLQLSSDSVMAECPKCGGEVKKLMSAPAFQFKGSGWYVTDYAGKGKAPGKPDESGAGKAAAGSSKAADSAESKGADKSKDAGGSSGSSRAPAESSSAKASSPSD